MDIRQRLTISHARLPKYYLAFTGVCFVIASFFILTCSAFAEVPTYTWTVTEIPDTLDQSYGRADPSIAVDNQDRPHISFGVNQGSDGWPTYIYYAYRENNSWQSQQMVWKPYACAETSIFLDSNSKVHIAYATEWGQGVWYRTNKTGSWQEDTLKGTWTGNYESMCIDDNGKFHVAYWNNNGGAEKIHYMFYNGTSWQPAEGTQQNVDTDIKEYSYMMKPVTVIATHGPDPVPYIIAGRKNGGLKYYYKSNGSWFGPITFGDAYNILQDPNGTMAFDSNNNLYCIVQLDTSPQKLYLGIKNSTQWSYEEIAQLSSGSLLRASLAIDTLNQIHVVYVDGQDIFYKVREGATWSSRQKVNALPILYGPKDLQIKLTSANKPRIVYSTVYPQKVYYVEIERPNTPPEIDPIPPKTVNEGVLLSFPVPSHDDDGDPRTYSLEPIAGKNYPIGATIGSDTGIFQWTPTYDQAGYYEVNVKVTDGRGGEDKEIIQITVYDVVNTPPEMDPIGPKSVYAGHLLTFTITTQPDPEGDTPTYSLESIPSKNYPDGAAIGVVSGIFEWTPNTTQIGSYEVRIKASDGKGGEDYEDVQITVQDANNPPVIEPIEPKTVKEGETLAFNVSATDPDGDPITYSLEPIRDKVYPADATLEETNGAFEWTPSTGDTGVYYAKVKVSDDKGAEDAAALLITIDGTLATIVPPGSTIQYVINDPTRPYDMIYIPAGAYYEDIIINENVTLRGAPAGTTIIKGNITIKNTEATIDNLTIMYDDGYQVPWDDNYPAQVLLADAAITAINANVTVKNCHIEPEPDFLRSLPGNETGEKPFGKGVQIWNMYESLDMDTGPKIENNIIQNADCAVYYFTQAFGGIVSGIVRNNTLYNNKYGVLLRMHKERPEIKNNIIVGGSDGIFLTYRDGALFDTRTSLMYHNDVWGGGHTYWLDEDSVIFDITGVNGSISEDPLFVDAVNGDFTLGEGSPCKGTADDGGNMGVRISLLPAPASPTVSSIPQETKERYISISGTKDINSSIVINGVELIPPNANTEWAVDSYDLGTIDGNKTLIFTSKNIYGLESGAVILNVKLDTLPPQVAITLPSNGSTLHEAPIIVTGTVDDPEASVDVNGVFAEITGNTFTAESVDLRCGQNTITATAYDRAGNMATDDIIITSTVTSVYELIKITQDTYYGDPDNPVAGSNIELRLKLVVEDIPKANEPIQFTITAGNGTLSQSIVNTDTNGEAYVTLTTDTNAVALNSVEAYAVNFPNEKVVFSINAKTGQGTQLIKLTDDLITPLPGATISLIVKLTDANNNPIEGQIINFAITQGGGSLSTASVVTNDYGMAEVNFTAPSTPQALTVINVSLANNPSILVVFSITTSPNSAVTIDSLFSKVDLNSQKIHDQIAEITVISDDPDKSATAQYKVWQKGDLMKVQNILTGEITIRPQLTMTEGAPADAQIINYDSSTNIYAVKTKASSQAEEIPYTLTYIDYNKGVITKIESYYQRADGMIIKASLEMMEFVQIPTVDNAWIYNKKIQKIYENNNIISTTITTITTRQTNVGLADSEFQQ